MHACDTHAHLDHIKDLDLALDEAYKRGVAAIVALSMDVASCRRNLDIKRSVNVTEKRSKVFLGMGMHPSEANVSHLDECVKLIEENKSELTAVGEIGLDFWYKWVRKDDAKKAEQREVFRRLLTVARDFSLPAIIHARGAWRECFDICQELNIVRAEFHWYSGPLDVLDDIIKAGYYVSTSPSVAYSPQSREAMAQAPIEQTLIETDCPVYYMDVDSAGAKQETGYEAGPKDVFKTLMAYSRLKGLKEEAALDQLNKNAKEFFGIDF